MVVSCIWVVFFLILVQEGCGCILYSFLKKGVQDTTNQTLKKNWRLYPIFLVEAGGVAAGVPEAIPLQDTVLAGG